MVFLVAVRTSCQPQASMEKLQGNPPGKEDGKRELGQVCLEAQTDWQWASLRSLCRVSGPQTAGGSLSQNH